MPKLAIDETVIIFEVLVSLFLKFFKIASVENKEIESCLFNSLELKNSTGDVISIQKKKYDASNLKS